MKAFERYQKVLNTKTGETLTVLNGSGFTDSGKKFIPCANSEYYIDDYLIDDLEPYDDKHKNLLSDLLNEINDKSLSMILRRIVIGKEDILKVLK